MSVKKSYVLKPGRIARLDGLQFDNLTVLHRSGSRGRFASWLCRCTCGAEVVVAGDNLRRGKTKSCTQNGHYFKKPDKSSSTAPTAQFPKEYNTWRMMHYSCENPNIHGYADYGARGITVCERWGDFKNFMMDMGRKPDPKFTIDRVNSDGNYEPANCRWVSKADQQRNKRNTLYVTYKGKRIAFCEIIKELSLSRPTVYSRLRSGWTLEAALATAHMPSGRPRKTGIA